MEETAKMLSREHHAIIQQFVSFKERTEARLEQTDHLEKKFYAAEKAYAQQAPCFEASFAMHHASALRLYNCLVPKVKELSLHCNRCQKEREDAGIEDYPVTETEKDEIMSYWKVRRVEADNNNLFKLNEQLKKEIGVIKWYVKYMEKGLNSTEIMSMFS